eukprot:s670_g4.t1
MKREIILLFSCLAGVRSLYMGLPGRVQCWDASKCVSKHGASHNRRNEHIVQKMIATTHKYSSRDICFLQESEATGLLQ